jgi:hypothetical protein
MMRAKTLLSKKLEELAETHESGRAIADQVASSSEVTAALFSSWYRPAYRKGHEQVGEEPDGVNVRFATR